MGLMQPTRFFRRSLSFTRPKEYVVGIELFGDVLRGTLAAVDSEAKHITILRQRQRRVDAEPLDQFTRMIPPLVEQLKLPASVRVMSLLDYRRATTLVGSVQLMRSDAKAELTAAELSNLVSQGVWKVATQQRPLAARKMQIPDLHVQLADADVTQVRLNGHRVVNPIGFTAKAVELYCRETFLDAELLASLQRSLTDDNLASVAESPMIIASLIARMHPQQDFLFFSAGTHESALYRAHAGTLIFVDSVLWGTETLLAGIARQFAVSTEAAQSMLARYAHHELSRRMVAAVEAAASGELAILTHAISAHQPREASVPVYIQAAVRLPEFLFDPSFSRRLGSTLSLTEVNEDLVGKYTGFVVQWQQRTEEQFTLESFIAAVADLYIGSQHAALTTAAKQRARWLQRNNQTNI